MAANATTQRTQVCPTNCNRTDLCMRWGDGNCDIGNSEGTPLNTEICSWDGGDCCLNTCNISACDSEHLAASEYLCVDPAHNNDTIDSKCPSTCSRADKCVEWGDGVCNHQDDNYAWPLNSRACAWDGGDCCVNGTDSEYCLDFDDDDDLDIIITASVAVPLLVLAGIILAVAFLRQRMKRAITAAKDAKRIITLVEDTAYSIPFHHLKIGKLLAAGGAGQVYEGTFSGQPVAIKELFSVLFDPGQLEDLKAEAAMLASLHHPNIVRFYGLSSHETARGTAYYLVTQLQKQTVRDVLNNYEPHAALQAYEKTNGLYASERPRKFRKPLAPDIIFSMMKAIAETLKYLHSIRIIHRDLKPENVLLDKDFNIYLCDFGIAKKVSESEMTSLTANVGTAAYMAPELMNPETEGEGGGGEGEAEAEEGATEQEGGGEGGDEDEEDAIEFEESDEEDTINFEEESVSTASGVGNKKLLAAGKKLDVYAFALMSWAMMRWRTPFQGMSTMRILTQVAVHNERPETAQIAELWGTTLTNIITQCWAAAPQHRPSMSRVCSRLNAIDKKTLARVAAVKRLTGKAKMAVTSSLLSPQAAVTTGWEVRAPGAGKGKGKGTGKGVGKGVGKGAGVELRQVVVGTDDGDSADARRRAAERPKSMPARIPRRRSATHV